MPFIFVLAFHPVRRYSYCCYFTDEKAEAQRDKSLGHTTLSCVVAPKFDARMTAGCPVSKLYSLQMSD